MRKLIVSVIFVGLVAQSPASRASSNQVSEEDADAATPVDTDLPMGPILLASLGVTVLAVGAGFGWQAYEENEDFNKKEVDANGEVRYPLATHELADDIENHALAANILMFSGLGAMIGSVLWWLLDDNYAPAQKRKKKERSRAELRTLIGMGRAGLKIDF